MTAIVSWALAQLIKIIIELIRTHRINWQLILQQVGCPVLIVHWLLLWQRLLD
ncbi:divergent PAP2 family protein [Lactococcus lactis]|nr:divergent PAP2 family protein [Lactococcus lactis]MDG4963327.1 divergent PAP2 family protein [Lactococcus lactis]